MSTYKKRLVDIHKLSHSHTLCDDNQKQKLENSISDEQVKPKLCGVCVGFVSDQISAQMDG